jgi:hypothetical protein
MPATPPVNERKCGAPASYAPLIYKQLLARRIMVIED